MDEEAATIKKITVEQLKPGMFVHDLNCGWMEHPFMRNQFMVRSEHDIQNITRLGIKEIYIDTAQGADVHDAPTRDEVHRELHRRMEEVARAAPPHHTVREELTVAHKVHAEAHQVVHTLLQDARMGKQIEREQADHVVERITESILRNRDALVSLSRIKQQDDYTFQHSVSVCALLVSFCHASGMKPEDVQEVGVGGLLHDIGKMRVPLSILNKPGRLTEEEFDVMKTHVAEGCAILEKMPGITETARMVAAQHHERHDGTGYPAKLKGGEITPFGQMASVVDVYDALTSNRCYHKGEEPTDVLRKLFEWSKHHFDEAMVQHFIRAIGIYPVGSLVRLESGLLAVVVERGVESLLRPVVRVIYDAKRHCSVTPRDIDLSKPLGHGGGDRIVSHERPEKWQINPFQYL